jgi:hypothetical protein
MSYAFKAILILGFLLPAAGLCTEPATRIAPKCPDAGRLKGLCHSVANRTPERAGSVYEFVYQREVSEAACVDIESDSDRVIADKVGALWSIAGPSITCDSTQFDVPKGNIIKFGIKKKFSEFVGDAVQLWKVDLNQIDPADGRTVLDYAQKEIELNRGTAVESTLRQYYDMLRRAGARHASEL